MISRGARQLRDAILAEAHARRVPLAEESLTVEQELPVLRLSIGGRPLLGVRVRLPSSSAPLPDVITVHGSRYKTSRAWPRKRDGTFNIGAVVDRALVLALAEIDRPQLDPSLVAKDVPAAASGLHVMHAGAVLLGATAAGSSPADLVVRVSDETRRARIAAHAVGGGLLDSDLRVLGDAAGLFVGRWTKIDDSDPLRPIDDHILTVLKLGRLIGGKVERRYVLLLARQRDRITIVDPSGAGVVETGLAALEAEWRLGASGGRPWVGTISRWDCERSST